MYFVQGYMAQEKANLESEPRQAGSSDFIFKFSTLWSLNSTLMC